MTGPLMRIIQTSPSSYERYIGLLTFGGITKTRKKILQFITRGGGNVLDIGCGAGGFIQVLNKNMPGVNVYCLDKSQEMLDSLCRSVDNREVTEANVCTIRDDALNVGHLFAGQEFGYIICAHLLSEIEPAFIDLFLKQCHSVMKSGGLLFIADEIEPEKGPIRLVYHLFRWPLDFLSFMIERHHELCTVSLFRKFQYYLMELPLVILSYFPNAPFTRPLRNMRSRLKDNNFIVDDEIKYHLGTFRLYVAQKA